MKFPSVAAVALIPLALAPLSTLAFSDTAPLLAYTSRSLGSSGAGAGASASQADVLAALKRAASSGDEARGPALYSRDAARLLASDRRALCDEIDGIALIQIEEVSSRPFRCYMGLPHCLDLWLTVTTAPHTAQLAQPPGPAGLVWPQAAHPLRRLADRPAAHLGAHRLRRAGGRAGAAAGVRRAQGLGRSGQQQQQQQEQAQPHDGGRRGAGRGALLRS